MTSAPQQTTAEPKAARRRPLITLEVMRSEEIAANMVRVVLGGGGFSDFADNGFTDQYVKLQFFPVSDDAGGFSDLNTAKQQLPQDRWPISRTYTVRRFDSAAQELTIDFVVHGDQGVAGPWAVAAQPGDKLALCGPGGKFSPDLSADFHLFCGDESALPAIAAALESLPPHARGTAFLEVGGSDAEQPIQAPDGVEVTWLHRNGAAPGTTSLLLDAVAELSWPTTRVEAFIHGERGAVKSLRDVVFTQQGLPKEQVSISGYWAHGRAEDAFQAEKRLPVGQI